MLQGRSHGTMSFPFLRPSLARPAITHKVTVEKPSHLSLEPRPTYPVDSAADEDDDNKHVKRYRRARRSNVHFLPIAFPVRFLFSYDIVEMAGDDRTISLPEIERAWPHPDLDRCPPIVGSMSFALVSDSMRVIGVTREETAAQDRLTFQPTVFHGVIWPPSATPAWTGNPPRRFHLPRRAACAKVEKLLRRPPCPAMRPVDGHS